METADSSSFSIPERPPLSPFALSVRQPWAWAIVSGGKKVENRTFPWTRLSSSLELPVRIMIHASSKTGLIGDEVYRYCRVTHTWVGADDPVIPEAVDLSPAFNLDGFRWVGFEEPDQESGRDAKRPIIEAVWLGGRIDRLAFGAIVGEVTIVSSHAEDSAECAGGTGLCSPWAHQSEPGALVAHNAIWHYGLVDPVAYKQPVRASGRLSLWQPDDEAMNQIKEQRL